MRIRITFSKTQAMRFTSHLDLHRTWERTLRRAKLPLAYSQGFNPHPRINLASALPLGFTGDAEIVDIWLENAIPLTELQDQLIKKMPPGMVIHALEEIDPHLPALQTGMEASEFIVTLPEGTAHLEERVQALMKSSNLLRPRRSKGAEKPGQLKEEKLYDLRPLILDMQVVREGSEERQCLHLKLSSREGATGRPEEILEVLGISPARAHVHRTRLIFQLPDR